MSTRRTLKPVPETTVDTPKNEPTQPHRDRRTQEDQPQYHTRKEARAKNVDNVDHASTGELPTLTVVRPTPSAASELADGDTDATAITHVTIPSVTDPAHNAATGASPSDTARSTPAPAISKPRKTATAASDRTKTKTPAKARVASATTTNDPDHQKSRATARNTTAPAVPTVQPSSTAPATGPSTTPGGVDPDKTAEPAQPDVAVTTAAAEQTTTPGRDNSPTTVKEPDAGKAMAGRLGPGELRRMVYDHLRDHPDQELTPSQLSNLLGRSSGAINNALETLRSHGVITRTKDRPRTYRFTGNGSRGGE